MTDPDLYWQLGGVIAIAVLFGLMAASADDECREPIKPGSIDVTYWNDLADKIHDNNVAKGFWPADKSTRNTGELLALIHSELSEATGALLNGDRYDDKVKEYKAAHVEIADAIIRLLDFVKARSFQLDVSYGFVGAKPGTSFNEDMAFGHGMISEILEVDRKGGNVEKPTSQLFYYLLDLSNKWQIPINRVVEAKHAFNTTRPFKHGKNY